MPWSKTKMGALIKSSELNGYYVHTRIVEGFLGGYKWSVKIGNVITSRAQTGSAESISSAKKKAAKYASTETKRRKRLGITLGMVRD